MNVSGMFGCFVFASAVCAGAGIIITAVDWAAKRRRERRAVPAVTPVNVEQLIGEAMAAAAGTIDEVLAMCCDWCNTGRGRCRCTAKYACPSPLCAAEDTTTFAAISLTSDSAWRPEDLAYLNGTTREMPR